MSQPVDSHVKGHRCSADYVQPHQVVFDGSLSYDQKSDVLDSLEQDARQLSEAASEGMHGGDGDKLHDVLSAKDALAASAVANDDTTVLDHLRLRQKIGSEPERSAPRSI